MVGGRYSYSHPDYDEITVYLEEPDEVIVAKKGGRCYVAFRGTVLEVSDWLQNVDLSSVDVYKDNNSSSGDFCEARAGYGAIFRADFAEDMFATIRACTAGCEDPDDCLLLTGHSQGGAAAALASILLHSARPRVITFGQPPAVDANCAWIPSSRFYRYVNSGPTGIRDVGFDIVPFAPSTYRCAFASLN